MYCKVSNIPFGYIQLTPQGYIKEVNETFLKMMEHPIEEVVGKHIEDFLSRASKMMFHSLFFIQLQLEGKVEELYITFKTKHGVDLPVLLMGQEDISNDLTYINCFTVKMSKRDDYEKELRDIKSELEEAYKTKEAALAEETKLRELFQTTLASVDEGIIVTDNLGRINTMNKAAEKLTGWTMRDAFGLDFCQIFNNVNSTTRLRRVELVKHVIETGESVSLPDYEILVSKDSSERYINASANFIVSETKEHKGIVISFSDVTKQYQQEKEIEWFLNINLDMLCVSDREGILIRVNNKFADVLGYSINELEGRSFISLVYDEDVEETLKAMKNIEEHKQIVGFTNRYQRKDGSYRYIEWSSELNGRYVYSSARDVTTQHIQQQELKDIAERDQLTGLYNRHYLDTRLKEEILKADLSGHPISMMIFDIDNFKNINDEYGHPVGDQILKELAGISAIRIRKTDTLIRFGGEEFIVLMPFTDGKNGAIVAEKIRKSLEENINPIVGTYTASFGVAERVKYESFMDWYERVDKALYRAKELGRNRVEVNIATNYCICK